MASFLENVTKFDLILCANSIILKLVTTGTCIVQHLYHQTAILEAVTMLSEVSMMTELYYG